MLREGKNREIRRILARLGHKVQHLRRIAVGPLRLGDLPAGAYRPLTRTEIQKLKSAVDETQQASPERRQGKSVKRGPTKFKPSGERGTGKSPRKSSPARRTEGFGLKRPATGSAVIGADEVEAEESRPAKRRSGKKRTSTSRVAKKRSVKGSRRSTKKSKGNRAPAAGRRGAARKTTKKKAAPKRRSTRKGKRSKD